MRVLGVIIKLLLCAVIWIVQILGIAANSKILIVVGSIGFTVVVIMQTVEIFLTRSQR